MAQLSSVTVVQGLPLPGTPLLVRLITMPIQVITMVRSPRSRCADPGDHDGPSRARVDDEEIEITESSGNVFADLGLPDAEERDQVVRSALTPCSAVARRGRYTPLLGLGAKTPEAIELHAKFSVLVGRRASADFEAIGRAKL